MFGNEIESAIAIFCICTISVSAQCGYNLSGTSGTITSPNYPYNYDNNLNCNYTLTSPENTSIWLIMWDEHLEADHDILTIYQGPLANQVMVGFTSDDSNTFKGFNMSFMAKDIGPCGGEVSGSTGYVRSPNYPNNYDYNMDCYYPLSTSEGTALSLEIVNVDLESCCDFVKVYDGPTNDSNLLGTFTGQNGLSYPVFASTNQVLVYFHSDVSMEYSGYEINFTERAPCGDDVIGTSGAITSPGYPDEPYPPNLNCYYKITTSENTTVALDIIDMQLEAWFDYIQIYDRAVPGSPFVANYSGEHSFENFYASSNEVTIYFHSDSSTDQRGFDIKYYEMDAETKAI